MTLRRVFALLATLLVLAVVAQFFLAASGAFDTAPNDESFQTHRALGYGIVLIAILLTIVAALARIPGRLTGMTGLVAGLGVGQGLIRAIAAAFNDTGDTSTTAGKLVFGLHAINGLIILAVAGTVARRARALSRSAVADRPAGAGGDAEMSGPAAGPAQPAS
jgi:FtsH-binding integral membrane protein